jgi:hypothetical protein
MNKKSSLNFRKIVQIWYSQIFHAMQCFEKRESENIKKGRKIYAARNFSDKCDNAVLKYPIKFMKLLIKSFKRWNKFSISFANKN